MARCALKRSLRPASCCSVDVMNGAAGERRKGRSVTDFTVKLCPASASATEVASLSPRTRTSFLAALPPVLVEVPPGGDGRPPEHDERGAEAVGRRLAVERALDPPPRRRAEPHARPLALDDHARGDALHAAGREPQTARPALRHQDRRDLAAVEAVEDATPLTARRPDDGQSAAPIFHGRVSDAGVIPWNTMRFTGTVGVEHLGECHAIDSPCTGLRRREVNSLGRLEESLRLATTDFFGRRDHVERFEPVVDRRRSAARAPFARKAAGPRQHPAQWSPDVADGRLDDEVRTRACRRWCLPRQWRLDDDGALPMAHPRARADESKKGAWSNQSEEPLTRLSEQGRGAGTGNGPGSRGRLSRRRNSVAATRHGPGFAAVASGSVGATFAMSASTTAATAAAAGIALSLSASIASPSRFEKASASSRITGARRRCRSCPRCGAAMLMTAGRMSSETQGSSPWSSG